MDVVPRAIQDARREAGLSLSQLAGQDISRQQIHHIEAGRSRPSLKTLQLIASRTGKPIVYFLADKSQPLVGRPPLGRPRLVERLEHLVATEDWAAVEELAAAVQEVPGKSWQAEAGALVGQAFCHLHKPELALEYLRPARAYAERAGHQWLTVECMDWEAVALCLLGKPAALAVARETLRRCRRLRPEAPDQEARVLEHLGFMSVARQDWTAAIEAYRRSGETGTPLRSLRRTARMYDNLKQAHERLGNIDKASYYAHRAISLYRRERDLRGLANGESNLAALLMRQGDLDSAEELCRIALEHFDAAGVERWSKTFAMHVLGEIHLRRGDLEAAERQLAEAMAQALRHEETLAEAMIHQTLGQLEALRERWERSDREYELALTLFAELEAPAALRSCHMEYGTLLRERREIERALSQFAAAAEIVAGESAPAWLIPPDFLRPAAERR